MHDEGLQNIPEHHNTFQQPVLILSIVQTPTEIS